MNSQLKDDTFTCIDCGAVKPLPNSWPQEDDPDFERARTSLKIRCSKCDAILDSRIERERQASIRKQREYLYTSTVPESYRATDPARVPDQLSMAKVLSWQHGPKGLLCYGPSGAGKSRSLALLIRRLIVLDGRKVLAYWGDEFTSYVTRNTFNEDLHGFLYDAKGSEILLLDDLATHPITPHVEGYLYELLETRINRGKPTMISTNHVGKTLEAKFPSGMGSKILRRLKEEFQAIGFSGKDHP